MAKEKLIVVESPAKKKTLARFLGKGYKIIASFGHIRDLPEKPQRGSIGVDIEKGFKPRYRIIKGKKKIVDQLKKETKEARAVYLASDPDREGEAIAWHIVKATSLPNSKTFRITFNEITRRAVINSLKNPGKIDMNKVDAQKARRVLDRIAGYRLSPLLWRKFSIRDLSAGRVQSVALKLVVDREKEIQAFKPREYWKITAKLRLPDGQVFTAELVEIDEEEPEIPSIEEAEKLIKELSTRIFHIRSFQKKKVRKNPPPPFNTSSLQQIASSRLNFSVSRTMRIAQQLYEGVELGEEGSIALITYMRTDSFRIAQEALTEGRRVIREEFGAEFLPEKPNVFRSPRTAQEAHEAIRPVEPPRRPDQLRGFLTSDQQGLYELIWKRFIASQMKPALYEQSFAEVDAGDAIFKATGSKLLFRGFTILEGDEEEQSTLPEMEACMDLVLLELIPSQHFTKPPPRFTEASLVKTLEKEGIGRPSTYATIVQTLLDRRYVKRQKKAFYATELGMEVCEFLEKHFPKFIDVRFTSEMEELLDGIEREETDYQSVLQRFYTTFKEEFERAMVEAKETRRKPQPSPYTCPSCGKQMVFRISKHGKFLGCSGYPGCGEVLRATPEGELLLEEGTCPICGSKLLKSRIKGLVCSNYTECNYVVESQETDRVEKCPRCGSGAVIKKSSYGSYLSCTNASCRWRRTLPTEIPCPREDCDGFLIARRARGKGRRVFYGCTNYPRCKYTTSTLPTRNTEKVQGQ